MSCAICEAPEGPRRGLCVEHDPTRRAPAPKAVQLEPAPKTKPAPRKRAPKPKAK